MVRAPGATGRRGRFGSLAIAAAVLLLAELGVRALAGPLVEPLEWRDAETEAKAEQMAAVGQRGGASVVVVGSSMTNAAVDPVALGDALRLERPAYNAALNGASMQTLETWVSDVVVPRMRPERVVIGLSSRELNANGHNQADELALYEASPAVQRLEGTGGRLDRLERRAEDMSYLVRYRSTLRDPLAAFDQPRPVLRQLGVLAALRVFEGAAYRITPQFRDNITRQVLNDYAVGAAEVAALRRLLAELDAAGVDAVVVIMPLTNDALAMHPQGAADYGRFVAAVRDASEGHATIDVTGDVADDALFADPLHLNSTGRAAFTARLATALGSSGSGSP